MIILLKNTIVSNWQYLHTSRLDVVSNQNAYLMTVWLVANELINVYLLFCNTGALFHSQFIAAIDIQSQTNNASTFAYLIDVSEDSKLIGISDRSTPTPGSDKSIMTKLVFGYPYLSYGGKFEFLNARKCQPNSLTHKYCVAIYIGQTINTFTMNICIVMVRPNI